jgi:elongation factor Ts
MSNITPLMVKELRERSGVGMADCHKALQESQGDMEKAIDFLRKKGLASAVKKEGRETKEGVILSASNDQTLVLVEMNCETDFVLKNEDFKKFAQQITEQALSTKPASLEALLSQKSAQDASHTVDEMRSLAIQKIGENIVIKRVQTFDKNPNATLYAYTHSNGKILTLVEIGGQTGLTDLAKDVAMHIAASAPEYLSQDQIPADVKAREEEIARDQVKGKPENVIEKIIEGKLKAFYEQSCLLNQKFVKDDSLTISQLIEKAGSGLVLTRFAYWSVGR